MILLRRIILMIQFFTRIPIPIYIEINSDDLRGGCLFLALIGALVGLLMSVGYIIGYAVNLSLISAILVVAIQLIITGGFHLDGLADTFDGIMSNKNREEMLQVMRDSRIGASGATAIAFNILIKVLILNELFTVYTGKLGAYLVITMPIMGKIGILTCCNFAKAARKEGGLGKMFLENVDTPIWIGGIAIGSLITIPMLGIVSLINISIGVLAAVIFNMYMQKKLGGVTGDSLGAINEICEMLFVIVTYGMTQVI